MGIDLKMGSRGNSLIGFVNQLNSSEEPCYVPLPLSGRGHATGLGPAEAVPVTGGNPASRRPRWVTSRTAHHGGTRRLKARQVVASESFGPGSGPVTGQDIRVSMGSTQ